MKAWYIKFQIKINVNKMFFDMKKVQTPQLFKSKLIQCIRRVFIYIILFYYNIT